MFSMSIIPRVFDILDRVGRCAQIALYITDVPIQVNIHSNFRVIVDILPFLAHATGI